MNAETPVWAVIPAAGRGSRMQAAKPKQYLEFHGKTVIEHCLDRLLAHPLIEGAIVVVDAHDEFWPALGYSADKPLIAVSGGDERHRSVYQGLLALRDSAGDDALALVHDAARPLVSADELSRVIAAARRNEAGAVLACPLADTLKRQADDAQTIDSTVPRERLWRAQTPQVFALPLLLTALRRVIDEELVVTDDAAAIELLGYRPALVEGRPENIKITQPADLRLAELIWSDQRDQQHDE